MQFAGLNYAAVILAAIAGFVFGAAYYGVLGKTWMAAARIEPRQARMRPGLFVTSFICELVMAWVLAGVLGHLGIGQVTVANGVISALFVWAGFIATTVTVNQRYQGFGWTLSVIDAGHWLGVTVIMGAIIGWMGV